MTIFRPSNINKRLVGTATTAQGGSPGNAGQIGPTKTPYDQIRKGCGDSILLGKRCAGVGYCKGVFKINESFCGVKELCNIPITDYKGNFICCQDPTTKWFVAPSCTEVSRSWYCLEDSVTVANSCMGSCGWFVPSRALMSSGYNCRTYWDSYVEAAYWTSQPTNDWPVLTAWFKNMASFPIPNVWPGMGQAGGDGSCYRSQNIRIRTFYCVS